ncbi:MAG: peptidylprolyl isomerase [Gammaproteobacteria bacterium]|nr:peptidylprolyl isomerase [Gammaproteobacteria bacterium]
MRELSSGFLILPGVSDFNFKAVNRRRRGPPAMLVVAAALTLFASVIGPARAIELDRIIAVVDDDIILQSELDSQMERVRSQLRQQNQPVPPTSVLERQLMERLIIQKIQLQLADRMGLEIDDRMLDRAIADIAAQNNINPTQFRQILEQEGYDFGTYREDIRHEIMITQVQQREMMNRARVTEKEVDNYLANQVYQGESDYEYRLSHILIAPEDDSEAAIERARSRAAQLQAQLSEGADFAEIARQNSSDGQAQQGGDLGWRKADALPTLFTEAIYSLDVGGVSDVITSGSGFHIVKLTDKRAGEQVMVPQTLTRHILIKTNELVTEQDARIRLDQLRLRLAGGADFPELARTNSDDTASALQGGDLGWVSPGQMVPEFEEVMENTPTGAISRPFESEFGWHILQVVDRRSYDGTEAVRRAKARDAIRQRKTQEEYQTWLRELRDEAYVELRLVGD